MVFDLYLDISIINREIPFIFVFSCFLPSSFSCCTHGQQSPPLICLIFCGQPILDRVIGIQPQNGFLAFLDVGKKIKTSLIDVGMCSCSNIAHFLGSTLFSFKYCSPFYLRKICTYFGSSIAHLEWFVPIFIQVLLINKKQVLH